MNWIEIDLQKGHPLNQRDSCESVTMSPLSEATDIIYLDFRQAAKQASVVLPVKYLIGC